MLSPFISPESRHLNKMRTPFKCFYSATAGLGKLLDFILKSTGEKKTGSKVSLLAVEDSDWYSV